jgi:polysaccharide chain length determinant protein (PEP-CTERM system associated)
MLPGRQYTPMDVGAMAWRHRWLILVPTLVGAFAALIVSSRLPNVYESEMLIQVVPQRVPDAYVRSTVTLRTEDRLSSLSEQIMSRTELEQLIKQMNLYPEERARLPLQDVVEKMRNQIRVEPIRSARGANPDADSFHVRFSYSDPVLAAKVTERLGALFIDVNARDRGDLAAATNNFLQTQLAEARQRLEQQEAKLKQFRERNAGRLPTQLSFNMQVIQNTQLAVQALVESLARDRDRKLMLERLEADAQLELVTQPAVQQPAPTQQSPNAAELAGPAGGTTAQQLAVAKDLLSKLELRLKPEHPDVVRTKRIIAGLEERLTAESEAAAAAAASAAASTAAPSVGTAVVIDPQQAARRERLTQMRAEIESLARQILYKEEKEQQMRTALVEYQQRIEQVPGVESEWVALTRDYDTQQASYKDLLGKSEQAKVATELEKRQIGEQFRILDPARTPVRPTGVNRLEINTMGAGIGFGVGVLLAALLEFRDRSFSSATDVLQACKLPVLALLPRLVTEAERRRARWRQLLVSCAVAVLVIAGTYVFWTLHLWNYVV